MDAEKWFELKPDRALLDADFEGYKLSLDSIPVHRKSLPRERGVCVRSLSGSQYSYQHVAAFGVHNHLAQDPWHVDRTAYLVDGDLNLVRVAVGRDRVADISFLEVFRLPSGDSGAAGDASTDRVHVSLSFCSETLCLVEDGRGGLFIVDTGPRGAGGDTKWTEVGRYEARTVPSALLHSVYVEAAREIRCLSVCVSEEEDSGAEASGKFTTYIEYLVFSETADGEWLLKEKKVLRGKSAPTYAALVGENSLCVASEQPFHFIPESMPQSEENGNEEKTAKPEDEALKEKDFTWTQTVEDVTAYFPVPADATKSDISVLLTRDSIELKLTTAQERELLVGDLGGAIDVEGSVWALHEPDQKTGVRKLELTLSKVQSAAHPAMWRNITSGEACGARGEYIPDPALIAEIHERLAHLTSDQWNADPSGPPPGGDPYSLEKAEECDGLPAESSVLAFFSLASGRPVRCASLAQNQHMFNTVSRAPSRGASPSTSEQSPPPPPPMLCLRHDVDAIQWEVSSGPEVALTHVATLPALGYIAASKQQRKFVGCPPSARYTAICECSRRVYVYHQPAALASGSEMRRRKVVAKGGTALAKVARQQVVSLDVADDIVGFVAAEELMLVLTGAADVYVVDMRRSDSDFL